MKKILAAILAAAMTLSLGITAFAAPAKAETNAFFTLNLAGAKLETNADTVKLTVADVTPSDNTAAATYTDLEITTDSITPVPATAETIATAIKDKGNSIYTITQEAGTAKLTFTRKIAGPMPNPTAFTAPTSYTLAKVATGTLTQPTATTVSFEDGKAAVPASGTDAFTSTTMLLSAGTPATPIAMVESASDLNAGDGVKSNTNILFMIDTRANKYPTDDFDFSVSKADSAKNIAKVSIVDKNFSSPLIAVGSANTDRGDPVPGTDGRKTFVQVELKENFTDAEFKISFTLKAKCTNKDGFVNTDGTFVKGDNITFKSVGKTWVANTVLDADQDFVNGTSGIVLKPQKNEDNEITWEDENDTVARLTFVGDSNVAKFYPKLSTKWDNADYAELFADQNAFYFDFVGNMGNQTQISSTSRATLEIYNPYYDKETDELTVDPTEIVIYQVATDGSFTDVSDQFTVGENDDGDSVYTTKTRELGTYIFAEKVLAAVEEEVVEAPAKDIPNTGR